MRSPLIAVLTVLALAGAGCSSAPAAEPALTGADPTGAAVVEGTAPAQEPLTVVATVYPLAWLAEQIAPEAAVLQLGGRGLDPHDLELTPSEHAVVRSADVAVYVGDIDFMPHVERLIAESPAITVGAAEVAGAARLLSHGGADSPEDHSERDEHADEQDHHDHTDDHADDHADDHDHDGIDPHLWFAPDVMADVAIAVGEAFAQADPAHADRYRQRAEDVAAELNRIGQQVDELLADCRHRAVIVSHEAYAYLLAGRGIRQQGVSGAGGHGEATPQRIAALVAEIEHKGIGAVLTEPVEGRQDAEAVAAEAGVELIEIYSLDIVDDQQRAAGYAQLLREQAEAVAQALECR